MTIEIFLLPSTVITLLFAKQIPMNMMRNSDNIFFAKIILIIIITLSYFFVILVSHLPLVIRLWKQIPRTVQSTTIAYQIPRSPSLNHTLSIIPKPILTRIIVVMEVRMVNFTSPAARTALGSVKENGQIMIQQMPWNTTISYAIRYASSDRL